MKFGREIKRERERRELERERERKEKMAWGEGVCSFF